ncbi:MAG: hypothetical protein JKX81_19665, partial [Arenicella sp.]|nr:hypothetical protein [Arenicella sp.]
MKILKFIVKWSVLFCATVGIIFFGLWLINAPEDLAENSLSMVRLNQSDYSVGKMDLEFVDLTRGTPALGGYEGDDKRILKGAIWFPEGK